MQKQLPKSHRRFEAKTLPSPLADELIALSQQFLEEMRVGKEGSRSLELLGNLEMDQLKRALTDDDLKKAFWINVYNAGNLHLQSRIPMRSAMDRYRLFFRSPLRIAGRPFSLNGIEHGLLLQSSVWWSGGRLQNPLPPPLERALRVEHTDFRVHFALNCGANGCPPIRFYNACSVESELEIATAAFFATEIAESTQKGEAQIVVSGLFRIYLGHFGGRSGLRKWIAKYRPDVDANASLAFLPYDWERNTEKWG